MLVPNTITLLDTMLRTVHLNDQLLTELGKVDDVSPPETCRRK
jgi:hypothetical protein